MIEHRMKDLRKKEGDLRDALKKMREVKMIIPVAATHEQSKRGSQTDLSNLDDHQHYKQLENTKYTTSSHPILPSLI